ncbi:hypothetical protein N9Y42_11160 [Mariniblastus sp.]|nr:hypothetical protein [Mariniblastus sp.]
MKLCEQIFGSVPTDAVDVTLTPNKTGQVTFVFSLPEQELVSAMLYSGPVNEKSTTGIPSVEITVLPRYSPGDLNLLKDLNDKIERSKAEFDKSPAVIFELPAFCNKAYGFQVKRPCFVPASEKSRRLLAEQMSLLFANTENFDIGQSATRDAYWLGVMNGNTFDAK